MKIPGYDKWKTTPPEPSTYCDCCGCELYEGDYLWDNAMEEDTENTDA